MVFLQKAAFLPKAWSKALTGAAKRLMHCTCVWDGRQVPSQDTVPDIGLMEMSLRQRGGNVTAVVANPSCLDFGHFQALATAGAGVAQIISAGHGKPTTCSYFRSDSASERNGNPKNGQSPVL